MSTLLSEVVTDVRNTLVESSANYWSDAELLRHAITGAKDLWRAIIDLNKGHFRTIDDTNVSLAANATFLSGVPADVFRVENLAVRDQTTASTVQNLTFTPKEPNHADWDASRGLGAVDPSGRDILYSIRNAGSPIAAPAIDVVPMITSAVNLRLVYVPTLGTLTLGSTNPIPGESDHALYAWMLAHALAKERPDRQPDPVWIQIYANDKRELLTALTPRQTQEPEVAEALFESYWG